MAGPTVKFRHSESVPLTITDEGLAELGDGATEEVVSSFQTQRYSRVTGVAKADRAVVLRIWQGDGTSWPYRTLVTLADDGSGVFRGAWSVEVLATHAKIEAVNPAGADTTGWVILAQARSIT